MPHNREGKFRTADRDHEAGHDLQQWVGPGPVAASPSLLDRRLRVEEDGSTDHGANRAPEMGRMK